MAFDPTPTQALMIFSLAARHGECPQAELTPAVKASDREALVQSAFVKVDKVGRSLRLTLTDTGWAWAASHLTAQLPPAYRTVSDLLARLGDYMKRHRDTLADVIGPKPPSEPPAAPLRPPTVANRTRKSALSAKPALGEVKKRIERAYLVITDGRRNRAVPLSRLVAELPDLPRADLDQVFGRILKGTRGYSKMSLMRHDDPRQLSQADRAAAYNPAGEPFHIIWIAS